MSRFQTQRQAIPSGHFDSPLKNDDPSIDKAVKTGSGGGVSFASGDPTARTFSSSAASIAARSSSVNSGTRSGSGGYSGVAEPFQPLPVPPLPGLLRPPCVPSRTAFVALPLVVVFASYR